MNASKLFCDTHDSADPQLTIYFDDVVHGIKNSLDGKMSLSELSQRLGLPFDLSSGKVDEVLLSTFLAIMSALAEIHHDESCNFSERPKISGSSQFILDQMSTCRTLKEALFKLTEVSNFLNGAVYSKVQETDDKLLILIDDAKFPYKFGDTNFLYCYVECLLIKLHCAIQYCVGSENTLALPYVSMKRAPSELAKHLRFWQGRIKYQSRTYVMSYDAEIGDIPLHLPAHGLTLRGLSQYTSQMISNSEAFHIPITVSGRVKKLISDGLNSQQEVSRALGMSITTMRRRLLEEGTSFREERKVIQRELSANMLESGMSAEDVTEKLGFSDLRSFSRAFKDWHGATPVQYQKQHRNWN